MIFVSDKCQNNDKCGKWWHIRFFIKCHLSIIFVLIKVLFLLEISGFIQEWHVKVHFQKIRLNEGFRHLEISISSSWAGQKTTIWFSRFQSWTSKLNLDKSMIDCQSVKLWKSDEKESFIVTNCTTYHYPSNKAW